MKEILGEKWLEKKGILRIKKFMIKIIVCYFGLKK